jgi:multiple sugar transport system substrate-binding protein/sn-glycerol 3-phosphate transport system substrate-binding protein
MELRTHVLSRRSLLAGLTGLGGGLILAACGGGAASPTSAPKTEATKPTTGAATTAPAATKPAEATKPAAGATTAASPAATSAAATKPATGATSAATPAAKPGAAATPVVDAQAVAAVDAVDLAGKNVEVVYWHNRPQKDQDLLQSMLDEFNQKNEFGVKARAEIAGASYNDVYNKINAAIQAGQPPDISVAYQNQAAFYRAQNAIIDLNPYVASKKYGLTEADLNDYFQTFLDSDLNPQFKGERLGFPTQRSIEIMYYNADWLQQLGASAPPKNWKEFEEIALKAKGDNKYGFVLRHDASNFASQVFARGGRILAPDGSAYVFNSEAGQETLAMIQRLAKEKAIVEIPTSERFGEQNRFANGEILFVFASSSGLPFYQEAVAKGANFKWDINLLPYDEQPAVNLYGASISVYKTTPERQLASWLAIKFLGQTEQTAKWAINTGYLPVRQSAKETVVNAYKNDPAWGLVANSYAKMFDWFQYAMIESPVAGYDPVRKIIDEEVMTAAFTDPNADVKQILDTAVAKANQILKENAPK